MDQPVITFLPVKGRSWRSKFKHWDLLLGQVEDGREEA